MLLQLLCPAEFNSSCIFGQLETMSVMRFLPHLFRPRFTYLDFGKEKKKSATKHINGRITLEIRRSLQFSFVHSGRSCIFYSHHDSLTPNQKIRKYVNKWQVSLVVLILFINFYIFQCSSLYLPWIPLWCTRYITHNFLHETAQKALNRLCNHFQFWLKIPTPEHAIHSDIFLKLSQYLHYKNEE